MCVGKYIFGCQKMLSYFMLKLTLWWMLIWNKNTKQFCQYALNVEQKIGHYLCRGLFAGRNELLNNKFRHLNAFKVTFKLIWFTTWISDIYYGKCLINKFWGFFVLWMYMYILSISSIYITCILFFEIYKNFSNNIVFYFFYFSFKTIRCCLD